MKKFIILLVSGILTLTGCCTETELPVDIKNFNKHAIRINGHPIYYYEITNPLDGHEYYLFRDEYSMIHSPECSKCKKPTSILGNSSLFSY